MKKQEKHKHQVYTVEITMCNAYCQCGAIHGVNVMYREDGYYWELDGGGWSIPKVLTTT